MGEAQPAGAVPCILPCLANLIEVKHRAAALSLATPCAIDFALAAGLAEIPQDGDGCCCAGTLWIGGVTT